MADLMRISDVCSIQNGVRKDRNNNIDGNIPVEKTHYFSQMSLTEKVKRVR